MQKRWYGPIKGKTDPHQTVPEETLLLIKALNPLQSHFIMTKESNRRMHTPFRKCGNFLTMKLHSNIVKIC